jgi:4-hydroxy-tetrahydrodipicolinate synthase
LAVFGTTSEANSMSTGERIGLLDALIDAGIPAGRLLPGTGMCALTDSATLTAHAALNGCKGVLMLPPFYYKAVSEDGLYASFAQVIERVGNSRLKVYLYHIPPVAQVPIGFGLIERLRRDYPQTVVGIKDSSGDAANTAELIRRFPDMAVFPGAESYLLSALRQGAAGCISATANINSAGIAKLIAGRDAPDAEGVQEKIAQVRRIVQGYPMIAALKGLLARALNDPRWRNIRPPLEALDEARMRKLQSDLDAAGFRLAARPASAAA